VPWAAAQSRSAPPATCRTAGERQRVVGEIADDAAVHEAVLLLELLRDRQVQLRAFSRAGDELRP
jgi:hypothetical protein